MKESKAPPLVTGPTPQGEEQKPQPGSAFWAATAFLTRLPIAPSANVADANAGSALAYFPLIGCVIGTAAAAVLWGSGWLWPLGIAVLLALLAEILLTGGLHEDGLADCCDACGGWTREEKLRILKDSRVGTFGMLGLMLGIGMKAGALWGVVVSAGFERWWEWGVVMVAAAASGRWAMVLALRVMPPVPGRESLADRFAAGLTAAPFWGSLLWLLAAVVPYAVIDPVRFLVSATLCAAGVWVLGQHFRRSLGGITGDCLGCIGFVSQLLVLLGGAVRSIP